MGNCLITKLKSAVTDETIRKYNRIDIEYPSDFDSKTIINISTTEANKVTIGSYNDSVDIYNGNHTKIASTPYQIPLRLYPTMRDFMASPEDTIFIEGVYDITSIQIGNVGGTGIAQLSPNSTNIELFSYSSLFDLTIRRLNNGIHGSIGEALKNSPHINTIFLTDNINNKVSGNIMSLIDKIDLIKFIVYDSFISGDLSEFADAMAINRTSGTLQAYTSRTNITSIPGLSSNVDITFTDDRVTYPRGWYASNHT